MSSEIWVEKYRPKKLEDVIADDKTLAKLNEYIAKKEFPHLLFSGTAGIGKTTVAKILANAITDEVMYINASDKTSVDVIRDQVSRFCATMSFNGTLKVIILDEFDGISHQAQKMLRGITEEFHKTCRFILTCNFENVLLDAIHSRFQKFDFGGNTNESMKAVAQRCYHILQQEGVEIDNKKEIIQIVKRYYPDIRKVINTLQQNCVGNKFSYVEDTSNLEEADKLIEYMSNCDVKSIRRELLGAGTDYKSYYRALFNRTEEYVKTAEQRMGAMLIIGEYMNYHSTTIDPDINFVTCLLQICKLG